METHSKKEKNILLPTFYSVSFALKRDFSFSLENLTIFIFEN